MYSCHLLLSPYSPHIISELKRQYSASLCGHPLPGFFSYARGFPLLVARSRNPDCSGEKYSILKAVEDAVRQAKGLEDAVRQAKE